MFAIAGRKKLSFGCGPATCQARPRLGAAVSIGRDLADFDHLFPARVFLGLELREIGRRVAHHLEAQLQQLGLDRGIVQASDDRVAQLVADVGRQTFGRGKGQAARILLARLRGEAVPDRVIDVGYQIIERASTNGR